MCADLSMRAGIDSRQADVRLYLLGYSKVAWVAAVGECVMIGLPKIPNHSDSSDRATDPIAVCEVLSFAGRLPGVRHHGEHDDDGEALCAVEFDRPDLGLGLPGAYADREPRVTSRVRPTTAVRPV